MVTCTSRLSDHWAKHSHRQTFYQIYNVPTVIIIKERVLQHSHRQAAFSHTDCVLTDRHRSHKRITFPLTAISQTTVHLQTNCVPTAKQVFISFQRESATSASKNKSGTSPMGLYPPLDCVTNPKYKLLHFLTIIFFANRRRLLLLTGIGAAVSCSVYGWVSSIGSN